MEDRGNGLTRPLLRYLGGKWRMAPVIIANLPPHHTYLEPFGGAAAILLRKPPATRETYNDLDDELVNLFQVLRSPDAAGLVRSVALTAYARTEYLTSFEACDDPVERARRTIVRSHFSHGNMSLRRTRPSGFRIDGAKGRTNVAMNWSEYPQALVAIIERLRCVSIENRNASVLIEGFNDPEVLIYADPPYMPDTRSQAYRDFDSAAVYRHEMSEADHAALLLQLAKSRAMVVLSGYPSDMYRDSLPGWHTIEVSARAHRNTQRTEVLYLNPAAVAAMPAPQLFGSSAA